MHIGRLHIYLLYPPRFKIWDIRARLSDGKRLVRGADLGFIFVTWWG